MIGTTISHYKILEKPPTTSRKTWTSAKKLADKPSGQVGEARLHLCFGGQGGTVPRLVRRSMKCEGGSPISTTGVLL
jgi:hypothetical protein